MKQFNTSCVDSTAELINEMIDNSKSITYRTLKRHVSLQQLKKIFTVYTWKRGDRLTINNDYGVSFHKSKYDGQPCVYVSHSAIEYIFT